jgi:hypothetical protein
MAGYGKLSMDVERYLPYHLFATVQNKLTMTFADGRERKGLHHTMMNMRLVEVKSSEPHRSWP